MKRIYGFDIGTTSIGWAVIEYDVIQCLGRILAMGARIFPEARDPKGTPLNQNRRQKRLVRRQIRRRKQRRRALNKLLAENHLLPPFSKDKNSAWAKVMALSPLPLRKKGLTEQLAPHELGRALYHLARLRHFKGRDIEESDKPDEEESAEEKEAKSARDITIKELKASGQTLGQMLAERVPAAGEVPRQQTRRIHALRSHVEDEFSRLVKAQESHHPALRDPAFAESLHETIFAQRPVFWRKNTLGQCRFIPSASLCPKGHGLSS
jgi:CRISPR-associated endonuclease Csn1